MQPSQKNNQSPPLQPEQTNLPPQVIYVPQQTNVYTMQQMQTNFSPPLVQEQMQTNFSPPFIQQPTGTSLDQLNVAAANLSPPQLLHPVGFIPSVSPTPPCVMSALPTTNPCLVPCNSMPIITLPSTNPTFGTVQSMTPVWTQEQIPVIRSISVSADGSLLLPLEHLPVEFSRSVSGNSSVGSECSWNEQVRSRRASLCSNPSADLLAVNHSWSTACNPGPDYPIDPCLPTATPLNHTPGASPNRGQKQELITSVRQQCHEVLSNHFRYKKEGNIMTAYSTDYTEEEMQELDELKDVLRGNNVGNIRAKSLPSLGVLVDFLLEILGDTTITVKRVDVILQKKKTNHLKGLLVNVELGSQEELVHVRDAIWRPLFKEELPKFMPAVFAQDCSWIGQRPVDLKYKVDAEGNIRVQEPLPEKLKVLGLKEGCRIKSMTVIFKHGKKNKPYEVNPREFLNVLQGRRFKTKNGMRSLSDKTDVTISFEEDWKTDFWRLPSN